MTAQDTISHSPRFAAFVGFLDRHLGKVVLGALLITALLLIPFFLMRSDDEASFSPGGEVADLAEDIEDRFAPSVHGVLFLAESRTGDMLTQAALWELYRNEVKLREADARGALAPEDLPAQPYLFSGFDVDRNRPFQGVSSIADAVQDVLAADPRLETTLEQATDEQVKLAVHRVLSDPATGSLLNRLSRHATRERRVIGGEEIDYWVSPAITFGVGAVNEKLGGGGLEIGLGGGEVVQDKEEFNRNVQGFLRGDQQAYRLWGIAIDANLEGDDEGEIAGIFIMYTVIGAVVVVGLALRSYWAMALTGAGLGILMIWLKGISNLVGLEGGLIIDLIVPVAMIALGVDFAVHAVRRVQEERAAGYDPRRALRIGLGSVFGALLLAMLSDGIAFMSNAAGGIEAIIHFGIAAGIAVAAAFVVLGVVVPLALTRIEEMVGPPPASRSLLARAGLIWQGIGVAVLSGTAVIFLVVDVVPPGVNVAILAGLIIGMIVLPAFLGARRRKRATVAAPAPPPPVVSPAAPRGRSWVEILVAGLARYRYGVLVLAAAVTGVAAVFALRLEASLDVKDFFDHQSDFVVGLDKIDEHVGDESGEPGIVYIRGDLTDPQSLAGIQKLIESFEANPTVARRADGEPDIQERTVFDLLGRLLRSDYALAQVRETTGVELIDADADGVPDSQEQIRAAYTYMLRGGVPLDEDTFVYNPAQVAETLFYRPDGGAEDVTTLSIGIPGTREQANVAAARDALAGDLDILSAIPSITKVGLTGSPFTRQAELEATARSLQRSIPIAAAGALLLLLVTMRSVRYAVVTVIPIGLVVTWLYALMYGFGFGLNFVTATIGAISIGVGIDYSIHMTERFREELRRSSSREEALRRAARGTGVALMASAGSSIVGFAILGFAPMPMFSSYGILTAIMIFLALTASLVVLPSLLLLVTPRKAASTG